MLCLRSSLAAAVAALLLWGGPAHATTPPPAAGKPTRHLGRGAARPLAKVAVRATPLPLAARPLPTAALPEASPQICLAGLVVGADGRPCPGVCVFPTTNVRQIAVTNAQGAFQLQVPAHTALSLQAEYVGLGSTRVAIPSEPGQPVQIVLGR